MGSSTSPDPEAGFATPAATLMCFAITAVVSATLLAAVSEARAAKARLIHTQLIYALDGAQTSALATVSTSQSARLIWRVNSPVGPIEMLAEPELGKLSLHAPDDALRSGADRLRVSDAGKATAAIKAATGAKPLTVAVLETLDGSADWRLCARSVFSPWSGGQTLGAVAAVTPRDDDAPIFIGQSWRIIARLQGWSDDRTLILTGNARRPVIVRDRSLVRSERGAAECDQIFDPAPA